MTTAPELDTVLATVHGWGAAHASAAVVGGDGVAATSGSADHHYRWASVTKLLTAMAALIAVERGLLALDEPAGPPGSTVRHLLSHTSGLAFDGDAVLARPGTRRIYSNPGFDLLGALIADRARTSFEVALRDWVLSPLGMHATMLVDRPSQGLEGPLSDLVALAGELLQPTLLSRDTLQLATTVAFPGLAGVVPGVGRFDPCDWGLGFELHDGKAPHWMATANSPEAFGHFGGAGTFLWVDPAVDLACVVLTDRAFGPWALEAWPTFSDAVVGTGRP
jgi:CubicO group peptidase (beta-lactamase class C family)